MSSTVTVRDIDPADKAWLKREARQGRTPRNAFRGFQAVFWTRTWGRAAGA